MPNGWKKNAKYFEPLTLTHDDYVRKKEHFRNWKKRYNKDVYPEHWDGKPRRFMEQYYGVDGLFMMGEYKDHSFYLSKCKIKGSGSTYRRKNSRSTIQYYTNLFLKEKKRKKIYVRTKMTKNYPIILVNEKKSFKKKNEESNESSQCKICCEEKKINELHTIDCKHKGVRKFRGGDKVVCSECINKMGEKCPYCKSHSIKFVKATLRQIKKNNASKLQEERKMNMNRKLSVVAFNDRDKFDEKRKYPSYLIYTKISRTNRTVPLDTRLYKWVKNVKDPYNFYPACFQGDSISIEEFDTKDVFGDLEFVDKEKASLEVLYCHGVVV